MTTALALPATITEKDFQRTVVDLARLQGWRIVHIPTVPVARGGKVRHVTTYHGHAGLPDLVLAKGGRVLLVELKAQRGRASTDQRLWLAALGGHGRLWKPADWAEIVATLTAKPGWLPVDEAQEGTTE